MNNVAESSKWPANTIYQLTAIFSLNMYRFFFFMQSKNWFSFVFNQLNYNFVMYFLRKITGNVWIVTVTWLSIHSLLNWNIFENSVCFILFHFFFIRFTAIRFGTCIFAAHLFYMRIMHIWFKFNLIGEIKKEIQLYILVYVIYDSMADTEKKTNCYGWSQFLHVEPFSNLFNCGMNV